MLHIDIKNLLDKFTLRRAVKIQLSELRHKNKPIFFLSGNTKCTAKKHTYIYNCETGLFILVRILLNKTTKGNFK